MSQNEPDVDVVDDVVEDVVDVAVVGAGMAGLYLLKRLEELGFSANCFEAADGVGGTWYWNRYPGARCDVESLDYSYSFDPELDEEWEWTERYATQPEILRYLQHVATRFDLERYITFSTKVESAQWDDDAALWTLALAPVDSPDTTRTITCRHYVMATGCLSLPKTPDIAGVESFAGEVYYTSRWPHDGVDFTGKRVGVIGTGSSAIQSIPIMAAQADHLTVFQRTPNFSLPAHNGPVDQEKLQKIRDDRAGYRESARWSRSGVPRPAPELSALMVSEEERNEAFEQAWQRGGLFATSSTFNDLLVNRAANDTISSFICSKIDEVVDDPETAEALKPTSYPFGTKRPCLDDGYYAVFNQPNVALVDLLADPIVTVTETGIDTDGSHGPRSYEFDALVFATGFDAMTGALVAVDVRGRDGITLADKWAAGPQTYLGLTTVGFPNFYMITGPGSPSVLSNMVVSIEQHVDWISDTLSHLRETGTAVIEPTPQAEQAWGQHVNDYANITLFPQANSWYMGANVPGKPRMFLPYVGGVDNYRAICDEVVAKDYLGFARGQGDEAVVNDGVIRAVLPDVQVMLDLIESLDLPPLESMSPEEARAFSEASAQARPPGPDVGEIVDGTYPAAAGELPFRLYRPAGEGPHPVVLYFHGGGWVLGSAESDDPICRDLCVRSDSIIVSVDYRHGPEARFPAAADDAVAALKWIAEAAPGLGGTADNLVVVGWSAGGNLAAVVTQDARDNGGPRIAGQVLLTPVTDGVTSRESMTDNAEGYVLTASLMTWFWDQYADPEERKNPKASPLMAESLAGLPPALLITCQFDPLRDDGNAYAASLRDAGVEVEHIQARGHTHTSVGAVDALPSGAPIRQAMAEAIRRFSEGVA